MDSVTYDLWEEHEVPRPPSVTEYEDKSSGNTYVYRVTEPTLTIYRAKRGDSDHAVIVLPGGAYDFLAIDHEGHRVAQAMAGNGTTAAVLKYRIPDPETSTMPEAVPLSDVRRALSLLRRMSSSCGFNPHKVGIVGFSAGSHLAAVTALWQSENDDENPDFAGYLYGVTNLTQENRRWLEEHLYYRTLTSEEVQSNTLLNLVTPDTPPAFIAHAADDDICKVEESTLFADVLFAKGISAELHVFPTGGHGFGLGRPEDGTDQWLTLFLNWMKRISV